jgi:hypothetical protein
VAGVPPDQADQAAALRALGCRSRLRSGHRGNRLLNGSGFREDFALDLRFVGRRLELCVVALGQVEALFRDARAEGVIATGMHELSAGMDERDLLFLLALLCRLVLSLRLTLFLCVLVRLFRLGHAPSALRLLPLDLCRLDALELPDQGGQS